MKRLVWLGALALGCADAPETAQTGRLTQKGLPQMVVITEVMQDPINVADRLGEWFEIHNPNGFAVNLDGWTVTSSGNESVTINGFSVPAGGFAVLGKVADPGINGGVAVDYELGGGIVLANGPDEIRLLDAGGALVDVVAWDGGAAWPNPRGNGRTMQLGAEHGFGIDNADPQFWCRPVSVMANGELGTPGAANDPCVAGMCGDGVIDENERCDDGNTENGDGCDANCEPEGGLVITEIMSDPTAVSDGAGEWFEVHNPNAVDIDIIGYRFSDNGTDDFTVAASTIIAAGDYAVLARVADPAVNGGVPVDYAYGNAMLHSNQGDAIIMRDPAGNEIDRVEFARDGMWPNPEGRGRSAQLDPLQLAGDNNDPTNWCRPETTLPSGDMGTPGAANDPCPGTPMCGDGNVDPGEACDDGNTADGDGCSSVCSVEGRIVIVEVMQDPEGVTDSAGEWFEVLNVTGAPLDLLGWTFTDEAGESFTVQDSTLIAAGGYAVLGRYGDEGVNGGITHDYSYGQGMILANGPDRIVVLDPTGAEIDRVSWDGGAAWPNPRGRGRSMQFGHEFDAENANNNDPQFWCRPTTALPSGNLGTPGAPNDFCDEPVAPVVVITEIMQDPEVVSDGAGEWFELHNPTGTPFDLNGWTFTSGGSESHTVGQSLVIPAGGYLVLGKTTDQGLNGGVPVDYGFGATLFLANQPDELIMRDAAGTEVDRVQWDGGALWPNPRGRGRTMQLDGDADAALVDNNDPQFWCRPASVMANGELGTPGGANDSCGGPPPAVCGDGTVDAGEECDDGNQLNGDGCDIDCSFEAFEAIDALTVVTSHIAIGSSDSFFFDLDARTFGIARTGDGLGGCPAGLDTEIEVFPIFGGNRGPSVLLADDGAVDGCTLAIGILQPGRYELVVRDKDKDEAIDYVFEGFFATEIPGDGDYPGGFVQNGSDGYLISQEFQRNWTFSTSDGAGGCPGDTVLAVVEVDSTNGDRTPVAGDDDGGVDTCSSLTLDLPPGDYVVVIEGKGGAAIPDYTFTATCNDCPPGPAPGDLVITEIMKDPEATPDQFGEYFEILNVSGHAIDLDGVTIMDDEFDSETLQGTIIIEAGQYFTFAREADPGINGGFEGSYDYFEYFLSNGPDEVVIEFQGEEIDRVVYDDATFPDTPGASLQLNGDLDPAAVDNADGANWCASNAAFGAGDFGTPNAANTSCALP